MPYPKLMSSSMADAMLNPPQYASLSDAMWAGSSTKSYYLPFNPRLRSKPVKSMALDKPVEPMPPDESVGPVPPQDKPVNPVSLEKPVEQVPLEKPANPVSPDNPAHPDSQRERQRTRRRQAAMVRARFGLESVLFTASGTEANLQAIDLAKRFTGGGRRKVLVFWKSSGHGSGLSIPCSASAHWALEEKGNEIGIKTAVTDHIDRNDLVVGRFNDTIGAMALIAKHAGELAAVLVEPVQTAPGWARARPEFMRELRSASRMVGALLILDQVAAGRSLLPPPSLESLSLGPSGSSDDDNNNKINGNVITNRLRWGGLADDPPDLTTLGMWLGGELPAGVVGGRRGIMMAKDDDPTLVKDPAGHGPENPPQQSVARSGTSNQSDQFLKVMSKPNCQFLKLL